MKRLLMLLSGAVLAFLGLPFSQCGDDGIHDGDGYEVHEWGVVVVTDGDSNGIVTAIPEWLDSVREPVIYFQGDVSGPISVKATFHSGWPTLTYPPCLVGKSTVEWDTVWMPEPIAMGEAGTESYVVLDSALVLLENVDSHLLRYKDSLSKFLFYEGNLSFHNQVSTTWDLDSLQVHLTNHGVTPVYNLTVSIAGPTSPEFPIAIQYRARVGQLLPGATADLLLSMSAAYEFRSDLRSVGFSRSEAAAFDTVWQESALTPYVPLAQANLFYRVPQSVYDSLISLEVKPIPDKTIRTLYALVHIK